MEVSHFISVTRFFQQFIKGYARITKLQNNFLEGDNSKLKSQPVELLSDALATFEELKMHCMTATVLAFADFVKPFLLEADTSIEWLKAVLSQLQDDGKYGSERW